MSARVSVSRCFAVFVAAGLSTGSAAASPVEVVTSIPPLAMIVRQIGGDRVSVRSILPAASDPHTFEPRPSDAAAVARARIVVSLGSAIDDWLGDALAAPDGAIVVRLDLDVAADEAHEHEHEHDHESDPHVWLDPAWVRDNAIAPVHRALAEADPDGAAGYGAAARAMSEEMLDLEAEVRESLSLATTRSFLAWHPAWSHFAERFHLVPVGGLGDTDGREPSMKAMAETMRAARAAGVRAVLIEPQMDPRHARVLADELGIPILVVDPVGDAIDALSVCVPHSPQRADVPGRPRGAQARRRAAAAADRAVVQAVSVSARRAR
jgi:zinc transport system substrate-binding protein